MEHSISDYFCYLPLIHLTFARIAIGFIAFFGINEEWIMRVYMSGRDSARSRRLGWARLRLIVGVGAACIWGVAQADMVVQPNSQYFSGWAFASITQPAAKPIPAGTPLVGMLGQRAFTITASGNNTPALDKFTTWGSATTNLGSVSLPADIGLLTPSAAANLWEIDRGELVYVFLDPLPAGTTLFSHDFDNGESVDYRFFRCDGTQIDASGFEFMQIATAGNPSTITRPAAGVADSVWHIAGVGTANNNITSGLILNSAEVCSIKTFSNNTTGRGSVDFTLGALAASLVRPVVAVPALGWPGMALLGVALAGLAAWRRRRG